MNRELSHSIDEYIGRYRSKMVEELKTLVRIPSVSKEGSGDHPYGEDCAKVLDAALELAAGYGLSVKNHGYRYGTADSGCGDKTIGIFAHLDVVPEGNGWVHAPYEPVEEDGYLIGRGVLDNKGSAVAAIHVINCIKELGLSFSSKISLYLGCDEESGMSDIAHYVKEQPMPDFSIVPDTSFPVCNGEKGIMGAWAVCNSSFNQITEFSGGVAGNVVPDSAQVRMPMYGDLIEGLEGMAKITEGISVTASGDEIIVSATGQSAHASMPEGSINAVARLAAFLSETRGIDESDRKIMAMVADTLSDSNGDTLGIAFSDEPSGELTCICGLAKTENGRLSLNFNIRYPVTDKGDRCAGIMKEYFSGRGWKLEEYSDSAPAYVPADDPKIQMLCSIYADITGLDATPYVMGGGTYSRKLRNAIGFGMENDKPLPFPKGHGGVHQPDEAIFIQDMMDAIKIYVMSLVEVDKQLNS